MAKGSNKKEIAEKKRQIAERREIYRTDLNSRLFAEHGDASDNGRAALVSRGTVVRWQEPRYSLPDAFQLRLIAEQRKVSPAWLAYNLGPKDPAALPKALELAQWLASDPSLADWIERYRTADEDTRRLLQAMVVRLTNPAMLNALQLAQIAPIEASVALPVPERDKRHLHIVSDIPNNVVALRLKEDAADYGSIPKQARRKNTRSDFPVYHQKDQPQVGRPRAVPMFLQLAAGAGRELEQCAEIHSFREFVPSRGIHAARVHGVSMLDTIHNGEVILLQVFDEGQGVTLASLERGAPKTPFQEVQRHVRDEQIWVLSINNEPPTLKRVSIFEPRGDWFMTITADNPDTEGFPRPIRKKDEVSFYAKMIGYVGNERD